MPTSTPLQLFIIYAREDQPALLELKAHLRPLEKRGDLTVWYDGEILPGADWHEAIKAQLATADIVLLFISKSFFNSEYIEKEELKKALERHRKGEATVVPVIVRPCLWDAHPEISALQVLPKDGKAVSSWGEADDAWIDVGKGIMRLCKDLDEARHILEGKISKIEALLEKQTSLLKAHELKDKALSEKMTQVFMQGVHYDSEIRLGKNPDINGIKVHLALLDKVKTESEETLKEGKELKSEFDILKDKLKALSPERYLFWLIRPGQM
ncbi:MAG: toll/interleukin-1 receptor domain-containing protein [Saprospiraceae bacterium]